MKISEHIAGVLLHESPVIVTGFGWFEKRHIPASLHPVDYSFKPPSAELSFVPDTTVASDLLAKQISESENIPIDEAHARICEFVADCATRLRDGNRVQLPPLGTLKLDLSGTLILEQNPGLNLNPESFGLPEFVSPAIQRRDTSPLSSPVKNRKRIKPFVWIAAASLLLLAALTYTAYQFEFISLLHRTQTLELTIPKENIPKPIIKPVDTDTAAIATVDTVKPAAETQALTPEPEKGGWYILAACFSSQHNAEKYLNNLKEQGFPASIEGQTRSGLHRVCYRSFASEDAAKAELIEIHTKNPNAYIIKLF